MSHMAEPNPQLRIIAGPNGSGKTTFVREFLPRYAPVPRFVNADMIAAGPRLYWNRRPIVSSPKREKDHEYDPNRSHS
jgi:hypothetical protein